jgi:hypothetical protein
MEWKDFMFKKMMYVVCAMNIVGSLSSCGKWFKNDKDKSVEYHAYPYQPHTVLVQPQ